MMISTRRIPLPTTALVALLAVNAASPVRGQGAATEAPEPASAGKRWAFQITPYILFSNIEGDAGVGRVGDAPVDVDFSDILANLEAGGMLRGEVQHESGFGVILDYGFMRLGADRQGALGLVADAELRQGVFEAFVSHRWQSSTGATIDAFGGVRWWDIDLDLSLSPGPLQRDRSVDWIDPVFGVRIAAPLQADWTLLTRWDIGGFGVGSDFSWTAQVGVQYRIGESLAVELDYKVLSVDYDEGRGGSDYFSYDTITHGPLLGLTIGF